MLKAETTRQTALILREDELMIFADKLINLRKKNGWSQEDLAEKMNVSRQSISKWEGAQSVPELSKILQLSQIFGVSTDYLLKDEIQEPATNYDKDDLPTEEAASRYVSMAGARAFLEASQIAAPKISLGVALAILSPLPVLFMTAPPLLEKFNLTEDAGGILGVILTIIMIAIAVAILVMTSLRMAKYDYLEKENIETEYGVMGLAQQLEQKQNPQYTTLTVTGIALLVLCPLPILISEGLFPEANLDNFAVMILLCLVALGVYILVRINVIRNSFHKLLEEEDFSRREKRLDKTTEKTAAIYWPTVLAIFLGYSFITRRWDISWVIWPLAALLFIPFSKLVELLFPTIKE